MNNIAVVVADDDDGHVILIKRNLRRGEVTYPIIHLRDGEEAINFFYRNGTGPHSEDGMNYVLLLDISMPKRNGLEILKLLKSDSELKDIPIIMVTTTDNPNEIERCYSLGCNKYITKYIDYEQFAAKIQELGKYIRKLEFPIVG